MQVQEVVDKLDLNKTAKDHIWKVEPSCATTGAGIFEGLVSLPYPYNLASPNLAYLLDSIGLALTQRQDTRRKVIEACLTLLTRLIQRLHAYPLLSAYTRFLVYRSSTK